jgi:hypothetical protein
MKRLLIAISIVALAGAAEAKQRYVAFRHYPNMKDIECMSNAVEHLAPRQVSIALDELSEQILNICHQLDPSWVACHPSEYYCYTYEQIGLTTWLKSLIADTHASLPGRSAFPQQ